MSAFYFNVHTAHHQIGFRAIRLDVTGNAIASSKIIAFSISNLINWMEKNISSSLDKII